MDKCGPLQERLYKSTVYAETLMTEILPVNKQVAHKGDILQLG